MIAFFIAGMVCGALGYWAGIAAGYDQAMREIGPWRETEKFHDRNRLA